MLHLLGAGSFHPDVEISNEFLEGLGIESSAEWIVDKIGVLMRRTVLPLDYIRETKNQNPVEAMRVAEYTPNQMAERAARQACERAGIAPEKIGMVIVNCCSPFTQLPTESQMLAKNLGIKGKAYDVFTACPAFALHLDFLRNFRDGALPDYILCVSTAALTTTVDYSNRSDSAIWGDGAAAWIVSPTKEGKLRVVDSRFYADTTRAAAVIVRAIGHFHQDGRAVRDFSVRQTVRLIKAAEVDYNIDWSRDIFIGHQANRTMLAQITNNRNIPETNHWFNVTLCGNQAGAGAPAVLAENWHRLEPGRRILTAVVGAGLSWGRVLFEIV